MYVSLIPILVMVFLAIKLRIDQYGLTEMRYIVCALLLRLLLSSAYMTMSKQKDLRWVGAIFTTIAVFSFISGPLSATGLAKWYQTERLDTFIANYDVVDIDGFLDATKIALLTSNEQQEIAELIRYLLDVHGPKTMEVYYEKWVEDSYMLLENLWLPTSRSWNTEWNKYVYLSAQETSSGDELLGYSRLYRDISAYTYDGKTNEAFSWIQTSIEWSNMLLQIDGINHKILVADLVEQFEEQIIDDNRVARDEFTYQWVWYKLLFSYINWQISKDDLFTLEWVGFDLLVE